MKKIFSTRMFNNDKLIKLLNDDMAMKQLPDLNLLNSFIPWTSSSASPFLIKTMLNEIVINGRKMALEFGCGISTIYLAFILNQFHGSLTVVESNLEWLELVKAYLTNLGLSSKVNFIHATLNNNDSWYDREIIKNCISDKKFDFVFVDGPEAWEKGKHLVRGYALPIIFKNLADDFVIFLDDSDRIGEKSIAKSWAKNYSLSLNQIYNFSILRPKLTKVFNVI